jgi:hypothetical protein
VHPATQVGQAQGVPLARLRWRSRLEGFQLLHCPVYPTQLAAADPQIGQGGEQLRRVRQDRDAAFEHSQGVGLVAGQQFQPGQRSIPMRKSWVQGDGVSQGVLGPANVAGRLVNLGTEHQSLAVLRIEQEHAVEVAQGVGRTVHATREGGPRQERLGPFGVRPRHAVQRGGRIGRPA